jgi:hypothetical protein
VGFWALATLALTAAACSKGERADDGGASGDGNDGGSGNSGRSGAGGSGAGVGTSASGSAGTSSAGTAGRGSGGSVGGGSGAQGGDAGDAQGNAGGAASAADAGASGDAAGGTSGQTGSDRPSVEGFRATFIDATCDNLLGCTWGGDGLDLRSLIETKARCVDYFDAHWGAALEAKLDEVRAGRWSFDEARAAHCLDRLPQACLLFESEEPLDAFRSICEEVFEGTAPALASCASDEDCAGSAYCYREDTESDCLGVCLGRVERGHNCLSNQDCSTLGGDFAYCSDDNRCVLVTLGDPAAREEPCGLLDVDEDSARLVDCEGENYCDNREGGTCRAPIALGAECPSENEPCEGGARCLRGADSVLRCIAFDIQTAAGSDCTADFTLCDAFAGLTCTAGGTCEEAPCNPNVGYGCSADEYCIEDATCAPKKANGEECDFASECRTGICQQPLTPANEPHRCLSPTCSNW